MEEEVCYARTEHGGFRVTRRDRRVEVEWPQGPRTYPNARKAILALYNKTPDPPPSAIDPHLCFDRYFRRGRYARGTYPALDTLTLFRPDPPNQVTVAVPRSDIRVDSSLAVHIPSPPKPKLGIDLEGRYIEVRKIFFAGFAARVYRMGYDPEDVFQDLCRGLLVRNKGKCPFDPSKSSFGRYIHMVANCLLSNYHRQASRISRSEILGATLPDGEVVDVALADLGSVDPRQEGMATLHSMDRSLIPTLVEAAPLEALDPSDVQEVLPYLAEGWNYKETSARTGISAALVSRIAKFIRRVASHWGR